MNEFQTNAKIYWVLEGEILGQYKEIDYLRGCVRQVLVAPLDLYISVSIGWLKA